MNAEKLSAALRQGEAYLIFSEENRRYFIGFPATDGWLLITSGERIFMTDSRYIEAARAQVTGCTQVLRLDDLSVQLPELCRSLNVSRMFIEAGRMNVAQLRRLRKMLPEVEVSDSDRAEDDIDALRAVKNETEIESILTAQKIAEEAFDHILGFIKEGVTEKEVQLELDYFMLRRGAEALSFETIAVSGANSSKPHGVPTGKKIECGDFVTLDYGAVVNGYHSDMTRTVAVGAVTDRQKNVYDTVLSAQLAGLKAVKAGVLCREVDRAARSIIENAGFGDCFRHSTGHGVGVEIHENPTLSPKSGEKTLSEGSVVTIEPGIYLPGEFGVRIEDMALVRADGAQNLTNCPKELIIL